MLDNNIITFLLKNKNTLSIIQNLEIKTQIFARKIAIIMILKLETDVNMVIVAVFFTLVNIHQWKNIGK